MADQGVLKQEADRRAAWDERDLRDPVMVLSDERTTQRLYDPAFTSPHRHSLDAYFTETDTTPPGGW
jgi:hypothetical protein